MSLLKGNKKNKVDTWRFRKDKDGRSSKVKVKENAAYYVTITHINKDGKLDVSSRELHSASAVNKVLRQVGIKKPGYPSESVSHSNDTLVKKRKLKGSPNGFIEKY